MREVLSVRSPNRVEVSISEKILGHEVTSKGRLDPEPEKMLHPNDSQETWEPATGFRHFLETVSHL